MSADRTRDSGYLFTHTNIRAGEFTEFKIAGNSGKNSVLITVSAIFQRKIGRNDNGFLPEQTFVQTGKEMGERHCRGSFGAEIVDNEQIADVSAGLDCRFTDGGKCRYADLDAGASGRRFDWDQ